jgi:hypothetical protein
MVLGDTSVGPQTQPEPRAADAAPRASASERFESAILPIVQDFLKRIDSLGPDGVVLPFGLPVTLDQVRNVRFAGGPSSTVCTFNVGAHSHFACHVVIRNGKELKGVNSFSRTGRDEAGVPRDFIQLTGDPVGNAAHLKTLEDKRLYPARSLEEVQRVAQRVLAVLLPDDTGAYALSESWQEQRGATALPFYLVTFTRKGHPTKDPSNLMRDEVMVGFKSTTDGLVFDFFEDNSIAFAGKPK